MSLNTNKKYKRILIKLSGASFGGEKDTFDFETLASYADQIALLAKDYEIGVVIGGGNIWRGNFSKNMKMDRADADYMGMLATVINGIAFKNLLDNINVPVKLFSTITVNQICDPYILRNVLAQLDQKQVCLFAGGTGFPYFTTDTGAAMQACNIQADIILMGKNGTDGVYNKDPNQHPDAIRFDHLTYSEVIEKELKVMDTSALTLCKSNDIALLVFNINEPNSIVKALNGEIKSTLIN